MEKTASRRYHHAALVIWLLALGLVSVLATALLSGDHAFRDNPPNALGIPEGLAGLLAASGFWVGVLVWLGREVWHGRGILGAVGFAVPICLAIALVRLAMAFGGPPGAPGTSLVADLVFLLAGVAATVLLLRAALVKTAP